MCLCLCLLISFVGVDDIDACDLCSKKHLTQVPVFSLEQGTVPCHFNECPCLFIGVSQ